MNKFVTMAIGCVLLLSSRSLSPAPDGQDALLLECHSAFRADMDEKGLIDRFGAGHVTTERLHLGEGEYEEGTVVFPTQAIQRVEIFWKDPILKTRPRWIRIRGETSLWRTKTGVSLGMSLKELETLNRFPFRLAGFAWDYEGAVLSWGRGTLRSTNSSSCRIAARLSPGTVAQSPRGQALMHQVMGDKEFSSGHPAMQELNPRVYEFGLAY